MAMYWSSAFYETDQLAKAKGVLFLTYSSKAEAEACIAALHNHYTCPTMPSPLQIKYAGTANERLSENKLFIGMVPKTATEEDLRPIFGPFGEIAELTLLKDATGVSKGCAFLRYRNLESATAAIGALNGSFKMPGSPSNLVVKFAESERQRSLKSQPQQQHQQPHSQPSPLPQNNLGAAAAAAAAAAYGVPYFGQQAYWADPYAQLAGQMSYANYLNPAVSNAAALQALYGYAVPGAAAALGATSAPAAAGLGSNKEGPPGANLFIYHIPKEYTDADLLSMFSPFGTLESCKVVVDKDTGLSKCFGFVSYTTPECANLAIQQMNGFQVAGKRLKVELKTQNKAAGAPAAGFKPY